jgi:hypothetical protein
MVKRVKKNPIALTFNLCGIIVHENTNWVIKVHN